MHNLLGFFSLSSNSRTFSFSFGIGGNGEYGSAGFDVSESYTSGNTYSCEGAPGQTVCVTALIRYTDYTVQEVAPQQCNGVHRTPYVIYAPDSNGQELFKCHHNENCHSLDWESWKHDGTDCEA